jgi:TRAP-type C4-dicarboxylate transport system permease large subunit
VDPAKGIKPIVPYLLALFAGTLLIAAVPWISVGFLRD